MSRTHLYRGARAARPLLSIIVASAWLGAALLAIIAALPTLGSAGAPAAVPDVGVTMALATGGVAAGVLVLLRELLGGHTVLRGARVAGATLLAVASAAGMIDPTQASLRPGPAVGDLNAAEVTTAAASDPGGTRRRLVWSAVGAVGAIVVVAAGAGAMGRRGAVI